MIALFLFGLFLGYVIGTMRRRSEYDAAIADLNAARRRADEFKGESLRANNLASYYKRQWELASRPGGGGNGPHPELEIEEEPKPIVKAMAAGAGARH